jgi:tRNA A22 N-methylase
VIAGDISPDCLEKTRKLIERYGLQERAQVRLGSGLSILAPGECDAAAILGMGGELMVEMLKASQEVAERMDRLVLQPMSGIEELRQWLYENGYHVIEDKLVAVGSRWYQLICVRKTDRFDPWPEGFPRTCWLVGYRSFDDQETGLEAYCREQLNKRRERLKRAAGTGGEGKLQREARQLEEIIKEIKRWN